MTHTHSNKIRQSSAADRVYMGITEAILWFMLIIILIPLIYVVSSSFSSPEAVGNGKVFLWPVDPSLKGYEAVFTTPKVWVGFRNSVFYTVVGTVINIIVTMLAAYPLSRRDLKGRGFVMAMFTFTMLFGGGMIPTYLLVRDLGMINTVWAMLLPGAMSVYNSIICRTAIEAVPDSLQESAYIDGANDLVIVFRIILPLIMPTIAVLLLYYGVGHWNAWFNASIYLQDNEKLPIQNVLRAVLIANSNLLNAAAAENDQVNEFAESIKYAAIVLTTVPVLCVYPFLQKYFVKGVMIGAVKG